MLLHTMIKKFLEVQRNMSNAFGIILFYKVVGWFDGQNIGVERRRPRFNPFYQHKLHVEYAYLYIYLVQYVCKCIVLRWVVDR
jgi:hypothetical protein